MNTQSDVNDGTAPVVPAEVMEMATEKVGIEIGFDCPNCNSPASRPSQVAPCGMCGWYPGYQGPLGQGGKLLPEVGTPEAPGLGQAYVKPKQTGQGRSYLPDDPEARARVAASEERREAAYHAQYEWLGKEVVWSLRREGWWMRMRSALGYPDLSTLMGRDEAMSVLSDAMLVLFLGLHGPAVLTRLVSSPERFQEAVETWADDGSGIPMSQRKAACVLFHRIVGDALECIPKPAPAGPEGRAPGN